MYESKVVVRNTCLDTFVETELTGGSTWSVPTGISHEYRTISDRTTSVKTIRSKPPHAAKVSHGILPIYTSKLRQNSSHYVISILLLWERQS